MEDNKQYDNNGIPVPETPVATRYTHAADAEKTDRKTERIEKCCDKKEDELILRFKWKHIKLAAMLLAAFLLGSFTANLKHANNDYFNKWGQLRNGRASTFAFPSNSFSIEVPAYDSSTETTPRITQPRIYYSTPNSTFERDASTSQNYSSGQSYGQSYEYEQNYGQSYDSKTSNSIYEADWYDFFK